MDKLWNWRGWHVFKWITGVILCVFIVSQIWFLTINMNYANDLKKDFLNTISRAKELKSYIQQLNFSIDLEKDRLR